MSNIEPAHDLLDKVILRQLDLLEQKIKCELNIESNVNNGSIHLAKSRYIMGQSSVSTTKLPTESSPDFSASIMCKTIEEDGMTKLKLYQNKENTIVPLHWFGVLVPQNLHMAQKIFQTTLSYVVECSNIQLQLEENMKNINALRKYLNIISKS